jgi:hypothetical protein
LWTILKWKLARSKENVVTDVGEAITAISLWFWSFGLKVNEEKKEIPIFYE